MKKGFGKFLPMLMVLTVCLVAAVIGIAYFRMISRSIYEDSTGHLDEIYSQVNRSFGAFVERNWGLLDGWNGYFSATGDGDDKKTEYILSEKNYWGFSEFYFLSSDGGCMTVSGSSEEMDLGDEWEDLSMGEPVMAGIKLSDGGDVTVFACPSGNQTFNDFNYNAIAISYTNADLASSLNVDAFSGKAKCFVIHNDGKVLLSTQTGGNVYENYLVYLKGASDIGEDGLENLENDWKNGVSGVLQCSVGGEELCILYQPVGYQGYILLSAVPRSVISAGFLSVQKTTMNVLFVIFLLIGALVVTLIIIRNNNRSRISRTELMYRERMFDVLSSSVDDIFIMLDAEHLRIDYVSPNIERLLGIPAASARSDVRVVEKCAVGGFMIPREELEAIPLNGSKYWECEYMHQTTGERRWYRMTIYYMSIQNVRKFISVMSDRTADQQMNQKLTEALNAARSANEAKSNFLSNMSHDIRTPMNAIVGFTELLKRDADDPVKVREYTKKISASGQHLLSLINDVLDMSKIESGKTSLNTGRFSLAELLEELNIFIAPQTKAKNQEFRILVQGAPPEFIMGDRLRLNQILINLLSNAVKYTQDGGKIDFTVSELSSSSQFVKLRFTVSDNGVGMSEEFQKRVFMPFSREINSVTNKVQGTGLGMAITKNLVDLMGGIISVKSEPGKGSTFTVELSFALAEQEDHGMWFRDKVKRLLVADDEEEICLDIKELMKDTGVEVEFVTGGAEAVAEAEKADREGNGYSVILLDWKMPKVSGVDAARQIREKIGHEIPILVLTSYDWADIEDEAKSAGINAFMPKPFFVSTFWQTIKPLFSDSSAYMPDRTRSEDEERKILNGKKFLVAEDNELNAEILSEMLAMEGIECDFAINGREAFDKFRNSEPGTYDMILMDVQMPIMNGYEATEAIRACDHPEAKTVPIAAMTANTFAEDVRNALDSGMNGHLAKPIDMGAVRELCCKLLTKKG